MLKERMSRRTEWYFVLWIMFWEDKVLTVAASSKVNKGVELFYLSHKVIKSIKTISEISCMYILYFILTGEPDS